MLIEEYYKWDVQWDILGETKSVHKGYSINHYYLGFCQRGRLDFGRQWSMFKYQRSLVYKSCETHVFIIIISVLHYA